MRDEARARSCCNLVARRRYFHHQLPAATAAKIQLEYSDLAPLNLDRADLCIRHRVRRKSGEDAEKPGFDATAYWARSGLMSSHAQRRCRAGQSPAGFGDHPTSVTLFAGIVLAIYQRHLTGRGANVRTSLMANGVWSNSCAVQAALCGAEFLPKWTRANAINPLVNHYVARDGRAFFSVYWTSPANGRACAARWS